MPICGGVGHEEQPDNEVEEIVKIIRPELESKLGSTFGDYKPISYRKQLVNGMNYFIKIHIGNGKYVHVRVYRTFQGETSLHAYEENKNLEDPIEYIQVKN